MKITPEIIQDAYQKASPEIKNLFDAPELGEKLIQVGKDNNLHTDQLSAISNEIIYIILNLKKRELFFESVKESGYLNDEVASIVTEQINSLIFEPLRKSILLANKDTESENKKESKEDILAEIENDSVAHIEDTHKLLAPLSVSATQTTLTEIPKPEPKKEEKKYTVDPYREPIL